MSFETMLEREGVCVTILTAAETTDRDGNVVKDWDAATSSTATGWFQADSTEDIRSEQTGQSTTGVVFLEACAVVAAGCRVVVGGDTFKVVGDPKRPTRRGEVHHVVAKVKQVSG